jgi:hypothetical protein
MYTLADLRYQAQRRTQEELLAHLKSFSLDIKLTVGIWYFAPGGGRFHIVTFPISAYRRGWSSPPKWRAMGSKESKRIIHPR